MSDGMSDAKNYGPSLSKHGPPIVSRHGQPLPQAEIAISATPCEKCGCGSLCHWTDLEVPGQGMKSVEWGNVAEGIPCQRCLCKGYRMKV